MEKSSNSKANKVALVEPYDTCVSLQFPMDIACSICAPSLDILSHKRKKRKTERIKSVRRKCKRLWETCVRNINSLTAGEIKLGNIQSRMLSVKSDHKLVYEKLSRKRSHDASNPLVKEAKSNPPTDVNKNSMHGISHFLNNKNDVHPLSLWNDGTGTQQMCSQEELPKSNSNDENLEPLKPNTPNDGAGTQNTEKSKCIYEKISKKRLHELKRDAKLWRNMKKF